MQLEARVCRRHGQRASAVASALRRHTVTSSHRPVAMDSHHLKNAALVPPAVRMFRHTHSRAALTSRGAHVLFKCIFTGGRRRSAYHVPLCGCCLRPRRRGTSMWYNGRLNVPSGPRRNGPVPLAGARRKPGVPTATLQRTSGRRAVRRGRRHIRFSRPYSAVHRWRKARAERTAVRRTHTWPFDRASRADCRLLTDGTRSHYVRGGPAKRRAPSESDDEKPSGALT
jgi:hypothetical protein